MPTFDQIQTEIAGMLSVSDEDLNDEQRSAMEAYLNELALQESTKVDAFAQFLKIQSATAHACKKEAQRLAAKARTAEGRVAWLKARYLEIMQRNNLRKVQGNAYALSVRESKVVVVPTDLTTLPDIYLQRKQLVEADKVMIREALERGLDVDGCELRTAYALRIH